MTDFNGKRFLITQNTLKFIAGSEVVTLELADYLQNQGANVVVYTYYFADPMKKYFSEKKIKVIDDDDLKLKLSDFDYIWVHHQVLPLNIINELGRKLPTNMPKFIFNHMSGSEHILLEHPYIWDLEDKLSSISLFNSKETYQNLQNYFPNKLNTNLFQNPAPIDFSETKDDILSRKLKEILIVSNHPPKEILGLIKKLQDNGYRVISLGGFREDQSLITPEVISGFDVVISIGKTVQYCLIAGIPVYVYDHFGGPGYLNDANYIGAEDTNFSGRCSGKKSINNIFTELINDYNKTVSYQSKNRKKFINKFSIDKVLDSILGNINTKIFKSFSEPYTKYLIDLHALTRSHILLSNTNCNLIEQLEMANKSINDIQSSKSYKIGRAITKPHRYIMRKINK